MKANDQPLSRYGTTPAGSPELTSLLKSSEMDTLGDREFQTIVETARQLLACDVAIFALISDGKLHFQARTGTSENHTNFDRSFCAHVIATDEPQVIEDVETDPRFADYRIEGDPRPRFYAGVPLRVRSSIDGQLQSVGTLSVLHGEPRRLEGGELQRLSGLASVVEALLNARLNAWKTRQLAGARQKTVDDLVKMLRQFREAERIANMGSWRMALADQQMTLSAQAYAIYGLDYGTPLSIKVLQSCYTSQDLNALTGAMIKTIRTGEPFSVETDFISHKGDRRRVMNVGEVEKRNGEPVAVVATIQDVTARYELERALLAARQEAEAAAEAKSQVLANVSHEIRTPMNGLIGFIDLLQRTELDTTQRRYVDLIAYSGEATTKLISDILEISKIESRPIDLEFKPLNLRKELPRWLSLMEPAARAKNVALHLDIGTEIPAAILGDEQRIRQILMNLVANALKFTAQGSVSLKAAVEQTHVGQALLFEVRDTGIGIAREKFAVIFQKFSQADSSVSARFGGTGLGLAISNELAKRMGGSIDVDSETGRGSVFSVRLPLHEAKLDDSEPSEITEADPSTDFAGTGGRRRRLLVVEDNPINQELTIAMAKLAGLEPDMAADGLEALQKVQAAAADRRPYDLVLMDIRMPHMGGIEATQVIRAHGFSAESLPIVALTANAFSDDREACLAAGMQGHLAKPIRMGDLLGLFARFFQAEDFRTPTETAQPIGGSKLRDRYLQRRNDALGQLSAVVQRGSLLHGERDELIAILHKLAGTAGSFDEEQVGKIALTLEKSLEKATEPTLLGLIEAGLKELQTAVSAEMAATDH